MGSARLLTGVPVNAVIDEPGGDGAPVGRGIIVSRTAPLDGLRSVAGVRNETKRNSVRPGARDEHNLVDGLSRESSYTRNALDPP